MSVGIHTSSGFVKVAGIGMGATPMVGATENNDGKAGLVPAPTASNVRKFLRDDGQWVEVSASPGSGSENIYTPTEPENPTEGQIWIA